MRSPHHDIVYLAIQIYPKKLAKYDKPSLWSELEIYIYSLILKLYFK